MHTITHTGAAPEATRPHHAAVIRMDHRSARLLYLETDACIDGGSFEVDWEGRAFRQTPADARHGSGRTHPDASALFAAVADAAIVMMGIGLRPRPMQRANHCNPQTIPRSP